jgi:mRNA interferase RelE/StbE
VVLGPKAKRFFEDADAGLQRRLDRCLDLLKVSPRQHPRVKALKGPLAGYWRFRVGDYRILYRVDDKAATVWVDKIAHRSKVYE